MMRTELEARLVFAAPSELLVATPVSSASQRLLGAYTSQSRGLRSQTAPRERYSSGGAVAAVTAFYAHAGDFTLPPTMASTYTRRSHLMLSPISNSTSFPF
jgi:hypothetical protein